MSTVSIYLYGGPESPAFEAILKRTQRREAELLRVEGDVAVLATEFSDIGEARYSTKTGRRLGENDVPHPWDFWRLDLATLAEAGRKAAE